MHLATRIVHKTIKFYQKTLSPDHGGIHTQFFVGGGCRFHPTCSMYAVHALERHGLVKGLTKTAWRVLRCNPLSTGGYDPA